ncbi:MAG: EAL domain-containing protein [Thermoflavifilum sp.]|nr:EAL domain-containing protein [Thermoflavifilum sp.]MCL6515098.1 EAL domain-containing protein [Alicyclobacillus sp.]
MVFQPLVDHCNRHVVGLEALGRPAVRGVPVAPDAWFREASDKCGADADLMAVMLAMHRWLSCKPSSIPVRLFVNVTPMTVCQDAFFETLDLMLSLDGVSASEVVIELLEYPPIAIHEVLGPLRTLQRMGVRVALDDISDAQAYRDFAAHGFYPDIVKIDKSIVRRWEDPSTRAAWQDIIQACRSDGVRVVAEGVETLDHVLQLLDLDIHLSQGYYWGEPLPDIQRAHLHAEIELSRYRLFYMTQQLRLPITDPAVVKQSQELDDLLLRYLALPGQRGRRE